MRTKTLVLAAALSVAGLATSMAQSNVYSLNVVGYVNVVCTNGFNLIANPLDLDGTGINNTVNTSVGTNLPSLSKIYAFNPVTGTYANVNLVGGVWTGAGLAAVNAALQPGGGVFLSIPNSATYPQTVTFVGNVLQGALATPVTAGYQMISSKVPQAGALTAVLGYPPTLLDKAYRWQGQSPGIQGYANYNYVGGAWSPSDPNLAVGEAVFLNAKVAKTWTRTFTVQ